ncbi:MAG: hypothetical protein PVG51_00375 [Desulfosarcina sp.]|jgi:rubrerythrin
METLSSKSFEKTSDLLELTQSIHQKIKRHYEKQKASIEDPEAKMLLDYITRKEEVLESTISSYRKVASTDVLDGFYQFSPAEIKTLDDHTAWQPDSNASPGDVLAAALRIDSSMQALYRHAARMAPNEPIRDLFNSLAEAVKSKKQDQASNASLLKDL